MARSLTDPTNHANTIKKLCRLRGKFAQPLVNYLQDPTSIQRIAPLSKWHLKNLRSDLSAWRNALEQLPPGDLFLIPWVAMISPDKTETQMKAALYEMRTAFYGNDLLIGSYSSLLAFNPSVQLRGQTATIIIPDSLYGNRPPKQEPIHPHINTDDKKANMSEPMKRLLFPEDYKETKATPQEPDLVTGYMDDDVDEFDLKQKELDAYLAEQVILASIPSKEKTAAQKARSKEIDYEIAHIQKMLADFKSNQDI